ncbi:bifunctional (p)ppGpp synthetase/guanosine-3',5'-bis(diphosphate) 3'-pyrophosphohydrolase [Flavisolibacter sp. BT320]|nr:bifunctional (p)ppGpp synthetase/guanosine-3',5'-bis(diphosphate) 3'-pyrophosphohydrolase [Flavisolibacter longurius]
MEAVLETIRDFADKAHGSQLRKYSPDRYIVHPVRVMEICRRHTNSLPVLSAALLHDVLEDTTVTEPQLHQFLTTVMSEEDAAQTTSLVVELTDKFTKLAYPRWNRRKRKEKESARIGETSGLSQTVKYADIIDNCREIVEQDSDFARVFLRECKALLKVMPKGDKTLYEEAVETVNNSLKRVHTQSR